MLQCSDVAQAEGTARWWLGGKSRGCATGRAGKWMQVASESPALAGGRANCGPPHVPGRKGTLEKEGACHF